MTCLCYYIKIASRQCSTIICQNDHMLYFWQLNLSLMILRDLKYLLNSYKCMSIIHHLYVHLTLNLLNFLNVLVYFTFSELSINILHDIKMRTWNWSANSIEPGQTAQMHRLAWQRFVTFSPGSILLADRLQVSHLDIPKTDNRQFQNWKVDKSI